MPKTNTKPLFLKVFDAKFYHESSAIMERHKLFRVLSLTHAQCTTKWLNLNSTLSAIEKITFPMGSLFSRHHSMEEMNIDTKNEVSVLHMMCRCLTEFISVKVTSLDGCIRGCNYSK